MSKIPEPTVEKDDKLSSASNNNLIVPDLVLQELLANKFAAKVMVVSAKENIIYGGKDFCLLFGIPESCKKIGAIPFENIRKILRIGISKASQAKRLFYIDKASCFSDPALKVDLRFEPIPIEAKSNDPNWVIIEFYRDEETDIRKQPMSNKSSLLLEKLSELKEENYYLDTFVQGAAHDLKGPMVVLKSYADLIRRFDDEHKKREALDHMSEAVHRLENVLEGLVELVNFNKKNKSPAKSLKFIHVFESVCLQLEHEIQKARPVIITDFELAPEICYIKPNLNSILYNLLSNALKYRKQDRKLNIHVKTKMEAGYFVIDFKDNGIGIDLEKFGHLLFKPFQRLCTICEGTGLGLCFVNKIVQSNKGKIIVNSQPNQGTTFTVYLKPFDRK